MFNSMDPVNIYLQKCFDRNRKVLSQARRFKGRYENVVLWNPLQSYYVWRVTLSKCGMHC